LSERQIAAVKKMMAPVADSRGRIVYPWADIPGTSTEWSGWHFGRGGNPATPRAFANYSIAEQFLRYMADPAAREGADPLTFNFDRDPATLERARKLYDATSFDLRAFKARGGKLLVWHGLADAAIVATSSVAYYEGVEKLMGGRAQTQDFFRVFLLPGMHHCFGGPGFAQFDELTLLENWVEKGQAPDVMIANRILNGVTQQRPIYPYPLRTRYTGQGDPAKAASYTSVDPSRR
jgi:feruloyl esterase